MRESTRGHEALRRGRTSIPGAEYFLTICSDQRKVGLTVPRVAGSIFHELHAMQADATWQLRCAILMPDHLHVLMILGGRLTLGKCVARLKAKTSAALHASEPAIDWERGFFDHHVRPDEDRLSLFLYIYLNPHRAALGARTKRWSWYYCRDEDWTWLKDYLNEDRPPPEWLM